MRVKAFVPDDFVAPSSLMGPNFKLRMLTIHDLIKDYDAVMSCADYLRGVFGPDHDWPPENLTLEQNLVDLGWHQKEFQQGYSFTYTVLSLDEKLCLGCVYIFPNIINENAADIYMWVRKSEFGNGLDKTLFSLVSSWIQELWPFKQVFYPYRSSDGDPLWIP